MNQALELPIGVVKPAGRRVTIVMLRGLQPIVVDEDYESFRARLSEFMNGKHNRGDQFELTTFYTWDAEVNKLHFKHIKTEPACLTIDGCAEIMQITPDYITMEPLERRPQLPVGNGLPFQPHGPGKRQ